MPQDVVALHAISLHNTNYAKKNTAKRQKQGAKGILYQ
jgi:hypothetical protein